MEKFSFGSEKKCIRIHCAGLERSTLIDSACYRTLRYHPMIYLLKNSMSLATKDGASEAHAPSEKMSDNGVINHLRDEKPFWYSVQTRVASTFSFNQPIAMRKVPIRRIYFCLGLLSLTFASGYVMAVRRSDKMPLKKSTCKYIAQRKIDYWPP